VKPGVALGCALLLAAFGAAGPAPAEPSSETVPLTLPDVVARARAHSARLAQLADLEAAAAAGVRGARAARWPSVDVSASYARNSDVPELTLVSPGPPPTRQTVFPNIPHTYRARAGLNLPLYAGGRISAGITSAQQLRDAAARDREGGEADLVLETTRAYWSLVAARESARVLAEAIVSYEAHLTEARNRLDFGLAARNEVLLVQVERERAELSRLEAANRARVANADLVRLAGLPPGAQVEPTEPLAAPPPPDAEIDSLVETALSGRPEIAAMRARIAAAASSVQVARSAGRPQLGFSAGYDYARPNARILPLRDEWNDTWSLGVSLSVTAFDGGRTAAAVAQARAQADAQRHQLEDLAGRIRLEVTGRALDLETARAQVGVAVRALAAAKESVQVLGDRYRQGVSPSFELLDAETRALTAGLDLTLATTQLRVAMASLDRAVGP